MGAANLSLGRNILRLAFPQGLWPEATDVEHSHHPHRPAACGSAQLLSAAWLVNLPHALVLSLQSYVISQSQCLPPAPLHFLESFCIPPSSQPFTLHSMRFDVHSSHQTSWAWRCSLCFHDMFSPLLTISLCLPHSCAPILCSLCSHDIPLWLLNLSSGELD